MNHEIAPSMSNTVEVILRKDLKSWFKPDSSIPKHSSENALFRKDFTEVGISIGLVMKVYKILNMSEYKIRVLDLVRYQVSVFQKIEQGFREIV